MTAYVDNNPKTVFGVKKPSFDAIPPVAILQLGRVMSFGKTKYGPMNWRAEAVSSSVYYNAALRHLLSWFDGDDLDPESGVPHLAHAMACMAILLDAQSCGKLNDDRPLPGNFGNIVETLTEKIP